MKSLKETDLEIYNEFMEGNWVVNKNPDVPFCALGADQALEDINRSMKVTGGLVGITLNPSARTKFFLIAPEAFVSERIQSNKTNLWSPMKKHKLGTWKDMGKKMKLSAGDKVVELQEDRSLFARMMVVCKSRPEINLKEAIGQYEFSVVPRSLFAADGTMHHCSMKSSLMTIIEKLPVGRAVDGSIGMDPSLVVEPCSRFNSDNPEPAEVAIL